VLRISAYVYNTIEDIDAVFTALDEIRESFAIEDAVSTKRG
jgi:selenocysteine lyase/cysteine desulfurase